MFAKVTDETKDIIKALGIYVLFSIVCYLILASIGPVAEADFWRTMIFLTCAFSAFYYKEEFDVVLAVTFGGPTIAGILYIIWSAALQVSSMQEQILTVIMYSIVITFAFVMLAGVCGFLVNAIARWISSFLTSTPSSSASRSNDVFSVVNGRSEIKPFAPVKDVDNRWDSYSSTHTDRQVIGILISLGLMLALIISLGLLPMYEYSFNLHLTLWDMGLIPVILIILAFINLLTIIVIIAIWRFLPDTIEKYPSTIVGVQSKLSLVGIFLASIFFPSPSLLRVNTFVVQSGIGIEILTYVIVLMILLTPAIMEYLQPLGKSETQATM